MGEVPSEVAPAPGVVRFTGGNGALPRLVAVNVDPTESDPARLTADEFRAAIAPVDDNAANRQRVAGRDQEESQHIWQYVLGLMMAVLVLESLLAMRTA